MVAINVRRLVRVGLFIQIVVSVVVLSSRAQAQSWVANSGNNTLAPASTNTRVGVGITAPAAQLDVVNTSANARPALRVNQVASNQNIAEFRFNGATKVFINAAGVLQADSGVKIKTWSMEVPDYVFDASKYHLTGLDRVEQFIKDEGHLPEIPAAAEMKENGMDLAEMNLRLLKKVEELTLYAIDQDKRIRGLETKLADTRPTKTSSARAR
jgi:hypothetical protein